MRARFLTLAASGLMVLTVAATANATTANPSPFCARLGHDIQASAGAQMFCFGPQHTSSGGGASAGPSSLAPSFALNVDAADPREDVTPSGAQAYGQSETSIAAVGPYVLEAWNDATGFFAPCPSPQSKEELTGFGFSADGGATFTDEGGLPNANCNRDLIFGDPSVEGWRSGGTAYFYVSSLYDSASFLGPSYLALSPCKATGTGTGAQVTCGQPVIIARSSQCIKSHGLPFCSFLDKEFMSIDPVRGRLYVAYTEFGFSGNLFNGQINLAVCDLGTRAGGIGPAGGSAATPVCSPGDRVARKEAGVPVGNPYLVLAPAPTCVNQGSYPAVDVKSGDVYVAYEFNWFSNALTGSPCNGIQTKQVVDRVRFACLVLATTSPCPGPSRSASVPVTSLDLAFVPGYNRFPPNDFPRIAVDRPAGAVSIVWNDARFHPLGDVLLQSFELGSLARVQAAPVRLNAAATGGLHFMPALRQAAPDGTLQVSWYERASANTSLTDVQAALGVDPRTTVTPATNTLVTTQSSDWNNVSSDVIPNFGDYTDNYVRPTATGGVFYVAWSDGRLGLPQPFEARAPAG